MYFILRWALRAGAVALGVVCFIAIARAQEDTNPTNTVTPAAATTSTMAQIHAFDLNEDANRYAELFEGNLIVSGGTHGTEAGLVGTPAAMTGYVSGYRITEPGTATITYPDNDVCWVIANRDLTGAIAGYTRVASSHFAFECTSTTLPAVPANSTFLMRVKTSSGAITDVRDLRTATTLIGTNQRIFDVMDYGAICDDSADDTESIQAALDASTAAGGGIVVMPNTGSPCLVQWDMQVGTGTILVFLGSFLKANGVPLDAANGECCAPGTTTDYNAAPGYRGGVLNLRVTSARTADIVVINPLVDCNYEEINAIGVGSGTEKDTAGLGPSAHEVLVLGGTVKNCMLGLSLGGGKGITAQSGVGRIRFIGTYIENCATGIGQGSENSNVNSLKLCDINGKECTDFSDCPLHANGVTDTCRVAQSTAYSHNSYDAITMRNVGCAFEALAFATGSTGDPGSSATTVTDLDCHNCGDRSELVTGTFSHASLKITADATNATPADNGVFCFMGSSGIFIDGANIHNESYYPEIGALFRGRVVDSVFSNIKFDGDLTAIFSGEETGQNVFQGLFDHSDRWAGNTYTNITVDPNSDLTFVIDTPGANECQSGCNNYGDSCTTNGDCTSCDGGTGCAANPVGTNRNNNNRFINILVSRGTTGGIVDDDSESGGGTGNVWLDVARHGIDVGYVHRAGLVNLFESRMDNSFFECETGCTNAGDSCHNDDDCTGSCATGDTGSDFDSCQLALGLCTSELCTAHNAWQFNALRFSGSTNQVISTTGAFNISIDADNTDSLIELEVLDGVLVRTNVGLECSTSLTAAVPCMVFDQNDVGEPLADFQGTTGADATSTISTFTTPGTIIGYLQIDVNGTKRWIEFRDDPS